MPLLEWEPPAHGSDIKLKELLKNQNPVNLRKIMSVREIVRILKMTRNWPRKNFKSLLPKYVKNNDDLLPRWRVVYKKTIARKIDSEALEISNPARLGAKIFQISRFRNSDPLEIYVKSCECSYSGRIT